MSHFTHFESRLSSTAHPTSVLKVGKDGVAESFSLTPTVDSIVELAVDGLRIPRDHKAGDSYVALDISFFECCLCKRLMYEPVTVTCGHSFCRACIIRSFDHSQACPMCRSLLHDVRLHLLVGIHLVSPLFPCRLFRRILATQELSTLMRPCTESLWNTFLYSVESTKLSLKWTASTASSQCSRVLIILDVEISMQ